MSAEQIIAALAPSVAMIAEAALDAILSGDRDRAAELAEEAARRQAAILIRRERSKNAPRKSK